MRKAIGLLRRLLHDEAGATAIEYALILVLVSTFIVIGVTNVGSALTGVFNKTANKLP